MAKIQDSIQQTIYLEPEVYDFIKKLAEREERSFNKQINRTLKEVMEND